MRELVFSLLNSWESIVLRIIFIDLVTLSTWEGDGAVWYIPFILICYLFYPIIFKFIFKKSNFIVSLVIIYCFMFFFAGFSPDYFLKIEQAITRVPIFLAGCYMGKKVYKNESLSYKWCLGWGIFIFILLRLLKIILLGNSYLPFSQIIIRTASLFLSLFFVWFISSISIKNRYISLAGEISLELYLLHIFLIMIWNLLPVYQGVVVYLIIIIPISFVLSYFIHDDYKKLICQKKSIN